MEKEQIVTAGIVVAAVTVGLMVILGISYSSSTNAGMPTTTMTPRQTICAINAEAFRLVVSAAKREDNEAVSGLETRGLILRIPPGTLVTIEQSATTPDGETAVELGSGFHIGTRCFMPTWVLRP